MKPVLTPYQVKLLAILRDKGEFQNLSRIGYLLFEGEQDNRKRNPSPQGMALAASRFVAPLQKMRLVRGVGGKYPFAITDAGLAALDATGCCHADRDGECVAADCPQLRDKEPATSGRHCPRDA